MGHSSTCKTQQSDRPRHLDASLDEGRAELGAQGRGQQREPRVNSVDGQHTARQGRRKLELAVDGAADAIGREPGQPPCK